MKSNLASILHQVMWDLWQTKNSNRGKFPQSTSVFPANSQTINCSTLISYPIIDNINSLGGSEDGDKVRAPKLHFLFILTAKKSSKKILQFQKNCNLVKKNWQWWLNQVTKNYWVLEYFKLMLTRQEELWYACYWLGHIGTSTLCNPPYYLNKRKYSIKNMIWEKIE